MKLVSLSKVLPAAVLALMFVAAPAMAGHGNQAKSQKKSLYPNATRKEPRLDITSQNDVDQINKGLKAVRANDTATAKKILEPYAAGKASKSKYAKALALQGLATIAYRQGDVAKAIDLLQKALADGVLPNDTYFQLQYELAQFYLINGKYQKSLDTVEQWRNQGKRETADSYALQGKDYYELGQYKKAITAMKKAMSMTDKPKKTWNQVLAASYAETGNTAEAVASAKAQLAKHPDDMVTLHNAVSILVRAGKYAEATALMEQERAKGYLKTSKDYVMLAKLHMMQAQNANNPKPQVKKALAILKEGMDKGIVKPGYESYRIEGDAKYLDDNVKGAIASYEKASKTAPDGELDLQIAKLMLSDHRFSAGLGRARSALKRGIKHEGQAYTVIAEAERAMGNRTAAIKAMREAEKDPTTRAEAKAWLKKVSR